MSKKRNGLSNEVFERMYEEQKGLCFICGNKQREEGKDLCVDHDHRTGKTRRLLCNRCNAVIGFIEEDPILGEKISSYIRYFKALYVSLETIVGEARKDKIKSKTKEEYIQYLIVKAIENINPENENKFIPTQEILSELIKINENPKVILSARMIGRYFIKLRLKRSRKINLRGIYFNKDYLNRIKERLAIE